ncbi:hypothetical protein OS493_040383, partial [Desmophyllum pertusum]
RVEDCHTKSRSSSRRNKVHRNHQDLPLKFLTIKADVPEAEPFPAAKVEGDSLSQLNVLHDAVVLSKLHQRDRAKWITMDGIRDVHSRIHTFTGIFLMAIPSLAHVLVIFVPPLIDGTDLKYYPPSTFNFSKYPDHLNWTKFWGSCSCTRLDL